MNKTIIYILLSFFIVMISCTKLEDKSYDIIISEQFNAEPDDIGSLMASAYVPWRELFNKWQSYFWAQEICTDELLIPKRPWGWVDDGGYRRFHYHQWTAEDAIISSCWQRAYRGITTTNRVIYQIESGQISLGDLEAGALAELKVLRATYYWVLCDMYGNVPIVTSFDVPEDYLPEQNTRQEVFDFIIKDINDNIDNLSKKKDQSTYGRMNKWVAHTLLAKLYLNAEVYTGTPKWNECIAQCDSVINSNVYELEANQKNVFVADNESSNEIIWALVYDDTYLQQYWADWNAFDHHMQTLPQEMQATYNLQNSPWGGICGIPQFINTFDKEDDARYKENWIKGVQYSASGEVLIVQNGTQKGDTLDLVNEVPAVDESQACHGLRLGKFEIEMEAASIMNNDFPFFRYADILMMKAECLLRSEKADDAATLVTEVRTRSFKNNPAKAAITGTGLMAGSSYDYGRRDIHDTTSQGGADIQYGRMLDELGWEFFEEAHRRQDLIRFGVFTTKSWLSHDPNGDHRTLYPIPQVELEKNSKLDQNPDY